MLFATEKHSSMARVSMSLKAAFCSFRSREFKLRSRGQPLKIRVLLNHEIGASLLTNREDIRMNRSFLAVHEWFEYGT
jgi:hypothetical protein